MAGARLGYLPKRGSMKPETVSKNARYYSHRQWGVERFYRWSHILWQHNHRYIALAFKYLNVFLFRAYIDCPARIGARLDLPHGGLGVVIGHDVQIGNDAIIFHNVTIGHAKPGPIVIGDRLFAGAGATILGPIRIGDDVTIGANATVTVDVPSGSTVVGPKARVISPFDKTQNALP